MAKGGDKRRLEEQSKKLRRLRLAIIIAVVTYSFHNLSKPFAAREEINHAANTLYIQLQ